MFMSKNFEKLTSLSLFFPAYNEEANIALAIQQALQILPQVTDTYEIIVVNDGSTDQTKEEALKIAKKHPQVRVVSQRNKGYGGALKRGFKESRYDWIFFTDSDLQFDLAEMKKFVRVASKYDLVLGYRNNRAEGLKRFLLAKSLKIWNRVLLGFPRQFKDIDCAFKLMRRDVVKTIEPLFSDGAMVSTEMLLKAYRAGFRFHQIGVTHYDRKYGNPTGSNFKVILKAVYDTFLLRLQFIEHKIVQLITQ